MDRHFDCHVAKMFEEKCDNCGCCGECGCLETGIGSGVPFYSTRMEAAWRIRAKMEAMGFVSHDRLTWMGWGDREKHPFGYSIWFEKWEPKSDRKVWHSHVDDFHKAPLAVCDAALKAMGKK